MTQALVGLDNYQYHSHNLHLESKCRLCRRMWVHRRLCMSHPHLEVVGILGNTHPKVSRMFLLVDTFPLQDRPYNKLNHLHIHTEKRYITHRHRQVYNRMYYCNQFRLHLGEFCTKLNPVMHKTLLLRYQHTFHRNNKRLVPLVLYMDMRSHNLIPDSKYHQQNSLLEEHNQDNKHRHMYNLIWVDNIFRGK